MSSATQPSYSYHTDNKILIKLHSKIGAMVLVIALIGIFFFSQIFGVYLGARLILPNAAQLSVSELLQQGSINGTVIALSVFVSMIMMSLIIYFWVWLKLWRYKKKYKYKLLSNEKNNTLGNITYTVSPIDYLVLKPFSLKIALGMLGLLLLFIISSETFSYLFDKEPTQFLDALYATVQSPWILITAIVIAAPIYEELMFRGLLWQAICEQWSNQLKGQWLASIVTSILFALVHLQYGLYEMTTIAILAMILCLARVKSGSLLLPILLHIVNNGLAMWQYVLMFEG